MNDNYGFGQIKKSYWEETFERIMNLFFLPFALLLVISMLLAALVVLPIYIIGMWIFTAARVIFIDPFGIMISILRSE